MSSTRKPSKQLSQTTISFPVKKSSASQPTKAGAKDGASTTTEERVKTPLTATESRAQAAEARANAKVPVVVKSKPAKKQNILVDSDIEETEVEDEEYFEGERSEPEEVEEPPEVVADEVEAAVEPEVHRAASSSEDEEEPVAAGKGKSKAMCLKDLMKEAAFKEHYKEVKVALGGDLTNSAHKESKATTILRRFDLSYEYGPCVGFTRMERWERANKLGLNPPPIVRQILETSEVDKLTDDEVEALEQSVFQGLV
ncbi:hypothetical protein FRB95_004140 [Tulasnella sp. JGI-2019a]|nr:hypothetical protein FRB95_004140 [Tulasnella sp. JGI-2019a]